MKNNIISGETLHKGGHNLIDIVHLCAQSQKHAIYHGKLNRQILFHSELERERFADKVTEFYYPTKQNYFYFIINRSFYQYYEIKLNNKKITQNTFKPSPLEELKKTSSKRRYNNFCERNNFVNIRQIYQNTTDYTEPLFTIKESNEDVYLCLENHNVIIGFEIKPFRNSMQLDKELDLKFKLCSAEKVHAHIPKESLQYKNNEEIRRILESNNDALQQAFTGEIPISVDVELTEYEGYITAEAQHSDFINCYTSTKQKGKPFFGSCTHYSLDTTKSVQEIEHQKRFLYKHAYKYKKAGNYLAFIEDYFIFDIELYSNLYHFYDKNAGEIAFINTLMSYRYDMNIIEELKKATTHCKVLKYLISFYQKKLEEYIKIRVLEQTKEERKIAQSIMAYILKLEKQRSNEDIARQLKSEFDLSIEEYKSYTTHKLQTLETVAQAQGWPFIHYQHFFTTKGHQITPLPPEELLQDLRQQIQKYNSNNPKQQIPEL